MVPAKTSGITEFPEEKQLWDVVENQVAHEQRRTIGGIEAGFLCRCYLVTPRREYLELARQYQAFSMSAIEPQFECPQVCKCSSGNSQFYEIMPEE